MDVVVAGAGAAGLSAALSAAESGLGVLLVEARETFRHDCNTAMSTAMVPAGGSRWQEAAGVDDSPQRFLDDVMRKTGGLADQVVARALTGVAPELVAWLADHCRVGLQLVTDFDYPGHSRCRCHTVPGRSGRTLHRALLDAVSRDDRIEMMLPARVAALLTGPDGAVTGAVVRIPGPRVAGRDAVREEQVTSSAVVLATNGFGADPGLVRRHLPEVADALYFGGPGSTGDMLALAGPLGADTACLDAYQGHGTVAVPHGVLLTWAAVMHGGILVNTSGSRFGDESSGYSEFARQVLAQPGGRAFAVFDAQVDAACRRFDDYRRCLEAGAVRWARDAGALARLTGAPEQRLADTLGLAAAAARGSRSDPFGRRHWGHPLAPPYAAVAVTGALLHTQGGLVIDEHAAALRRGIPIPGLYAAGGAAVGMSGHGSGGYLAGNGLLAALGLGYLAGRAAAAR